MNPFKGKEAVKLNEMLHGWLQAATMLKAGEISQEQYDRWRHCYPQYDTSQRWVKVPSRELSDKLIEVLKNETVESVSSYSMDIEKVLPNRCRGGIRDLKNPVNPDFLWLPGSFPLDRAAGFRGQVVEYPVYAGHFGSDAGGDVF